MKRRLAALASRTPRGSARRAIAGAVAMGTLGSVLAVAAPASAASAAHRQPAGDSVDLGALRASLKAVVAAGAPGAFARVSGKGGYDATVGVGTGDLATGKPVDTAGLFRVGSITKTFTAVLVLQLVAEHKVALDAPANRYLPSGVLPARSAVTVRELLDHTSGLYDYTEDLLTGDTVTAYQKFRYRIYRPRDLVADAVRHGQQFPPGSRYNYSNTNFVVLGLLVEHVTGRPYASVLRGRIIEPLGLTHTRFVVPRTTIDGPHAVGYLTDDNRANPLFDATNQTASWIWSAGAAISSTADLNRFLHALTTGRLLPPAQLAQMERTIAVSATSRYGLGLREYDLSCGVRVFGHDGIIEGYQTYTYTTKDGARQVTVSADASNNPKVFAAERQVLEPVFCGRPASAAAQKQAAADAGRTSHEEAAGRR